MKRYIVLTLGSLLFFTLSSPALARLDWEINTNFTVNDTPLDLASSFDGKTIFILTKGKVLIHSRDGLLKETIPVDPAMDSIAVSGLAAARIEDKIYLSSSTSKAVQEINYSFVMHIDTTDSPFLGEENAPVEIVVFSEFQCPHCSRLGQLFEQVQDANPDIVKIVFKNFPLRMHKNAKPAALAALAAHNQGKFWQYHDELYSDISKISAPYCLDLAEKLELDMEKFKKDLSSPEIAKHLIKDMQDGKKIGVRGTPSIFVNGRKLKERNLLSVQKMINQELQRLKK